ncbi:MAG: alpha/beta hydrolase [Deltaproteobacteria bacterium]|nr:alpha/beta hydrolase [Deltaproteobacteria bacterium]
MYGINMSIKTTILHSVFVCLVLMSCGAPAPEANTPRPEGADAEPDEIRSLPGFSSTLVPDPVFEGRIYILEVGPKDAPPLVLVHGVGAEGSADWYPVLAGLSTHYRVLALDLPGFGRSSKGNGGYGPAKFVKAIRELTRNRIGEPFFLVGHSMGGAISLLYAGTHPGDVKRLVLADVAGVLHRHALANHIDALITGRDGGPPVPRGLLSGLTHGFKQILKVTDISPDRLLEPDSPTTALNNKPQAAAALSLVAFNFGPATGDIQAPTRLLWGRNDNVAPLRTARALLSRIEGAKLTLFEHSAHVPMKTEPEAFVDAVHRHLQNADPMPSAPRSNAVAKPKQGRCHGQTNVRFEGTYDAIAIEECSGVVLNRVTAASVTVKDSTVTLNDTTINGASVGLTAVDAVLSLTGGRISGDIAIHADDVVLDMAGVHVVGNKRAFSETSSGEITSSICRVESPIMNAYVHDLISFNASNPIEKRDSRHPDTGRD